MAIFDSRFSRYESARRNRQVRFPVAYYNHGHGTLQEGNEVHGTACTETVFDHVPQAEYYLHKIETLTDLGSAVRQCKTDNVRIISHSLSWFRTGWGDNSGGACAAANDAARNNILFFTSSGNYNDKNHYQANRLNGSNFHNWGNGDELNNFSLAPNATVKIHLQWADGPDFLNDDYDLFLYDLSNGTPRQIASSQNANDFEYIDYKNNGQNVMSLGLAVKQDGNDNNPFEIFAYSDDEKSKLEYYSNSNNTPSPANATEANVIVVGAVERTDYNSPTGSNNITNYSSVGPTNDGKLNLDIVAPTATSTISYINTDTNPNGYFGGTSCATPNAAGTVAAFWSEHPNMTANNIREITFRMAQLYNDWGTLGLDNIYGNGGIRLYDFAPNTQFVYSHSLAQFPFLEPYPHPRSADTYAPVGSNIVMLAQNYNVLSVPVKLNKKMIYRSAVKASSIR